MNHVRFDKKNLFFKALGWCSIDRCDEMDGWCFHHKLAIYIHRAIQITKVALSTLHIINYIPKVFETAKVDTPYLTLNDLGFPTQDVHESLREFWGAAVVVIHDLNVNVMIMTYRPICLYSAKTHYPWPCAYMEPHLGHHCVCWLTRQKWFLGLICKVGNYPFQRFFAYKLYDTLC